MAKMWLMVNGLQLIVYLPLIQLQFPAATATFINNLINIATFDLIPTDLIYPSIYDFEESEPYNIYFDTVGISSVFLAENMGTAYVMTHIFIVCYLFVGLFILLRNTCSCALRFSNFLKRVFLWNILIVFIMEAYIETGLNSVIVIKRWGWSAQNKINEKLNHIYAVTFLVVLTTYPFILVSIYIF